MSEQPTEYSEHDDPVDYQEDGDHSGHDDHALHTGHVEPIQDRVATLGHVDEYLKFGQEYDCSDIHLATSSRPCWRRYGALQEIWPKLKHWS